jgi:hypothetical protein
MVIGKIEQLEDRIKIELNFTNGQGIPDETRNVEVLYSDVPNLPCEPLIPTRDNDNRLWAEYVDVSKIGARIAYHFLDWQESCLARMQRLEGGPYLVSQSVAPKPDAPKSS